MALTSIHVQDDRYTVTQSNTSIKEQKIWRSAVPRANHKQATFTCTSSPGVRSTPTHTNASECDLYRRHTWTENKTRTKEGKKKNKKTREEGFRWVFQDTLCAWRSMQVNISTSYASSKLIGCLKVINTTVQSGAKERNQRKSTVGPISQRQRKNVGCLYDDLTKLRK